MSKKKADRGYLQRVICWCVSPCVQRGLVFGSTLLYTLHTGEEFYLQWSIWQDQYRHVASGGSQGGWAALFLAATIFLKFTCKKMNYHWVAPPHPALSCNVQYYFKRMTALSAGFESFSAVLLRLLYFLSYITFGLLYKRLITIFKKKIF